MPLPVAAMGTTGDVSLLPSESRALLALFQSVQLQSGQFTTGACALVVPTTVFFALRKLRVLHVLDARKLAREHASLLDLVARVHAVEVVGSNFEGRSLDMEMFQSLRMLTVRKLRLFGLTNLENLVSLELADCQVECSLQSLSTLRTLKLERTAVPAKELPGIAHSLRWISIVASAEEFDAPLWRQPRLDKHMAQLTPWDGVTRVELRSCRVPFTKLDASWEKLVNLTVLAVSSHELHSLKQLEVLQRCVNLQVLDLSYNRLHSVEFLPTIAPGLIRLNISFNAIEFLVGIHTLSRLRDLNMEGNQVAEWCEVSDLAAGCPQLSALSIRANPLLNKFARKDDIFPFTASIFGFRPLHVNGTRADKFRRKVTSEFIAKYIHLFERRGAASVADHDRPPSDGGAGGLRLVRQRSASRRTIGAESRESRGSLPPARVVRKRRIVRRRLIEVDKQEAPPDLPKSHLDADTIASDPVEKRSIDPTTLKVEHGDAWLLHANAIDAAQRLSRSTRPRRALLVAPATVLTPMRPAATTTTRAAIPATSAAAAAVIPAAASSPPRAALERWEGAVSRLEPQPMAAPAALPCRDATKTGAVSPARGSGAPAVPTSDPAIRIDSASNSHSSPTTPDGPPLGSHAEEVPAAGSPPKIVEGSAQPTPALEHLERVALPVSQTSSHRAVSPEGSSFSGVGSPILFPEEEAQLPQPRFHRPSPVVDTVNPLGAPRVDPACPPIPLLQAFLEKCRSHDWVYREGDQRVKAFPSGGGIFASAFSEENERLWGIIVPSAPPCTNDAQCEKATVSTALCEQQRRLLDVHPSALELLVHDARDGSHMFTDRHFQKTLVRLLEYHSGTTRYIRIESAGMDERGIPPKWSEVPRAVLTVVFEERATTQPLDVGLEVISSVEESRASGPVRRRGTDLFDRLDSESATFEPSSLIHRDFFRVSRPKLLAGFVVPKGPASGVFVDLLKKQLLACHDRLCAAGVMKEWPLHLDDDAAAALISERDRCVPVHLTLPHIVERLSKHVEDDVARQRMGAQILVAGDELRLNVNSFVLTGDLAGEQLVNVVYANYVTDSFEYAEAAVLVIFTSASILLAHDHNFVGSPARGSTEKAFLLFKTLPLQDVVAAVVSFNLQSVCVQTRHQSSLGIVLHTRDTGSTLTVLAALQSAAKQAKRDPPEIRVEPCGYAELTKAPLIFSVSLFMRPLGDVAPRNGADFSFPARDVRGALQPVTLVITANEIALFQELDSFTDTHMCVELLRRPLATLRSIAVASKNAPFPLLFAIDFGGPSQANLPERLFFAAQHPNTIASVFVELRQRTALEVKALTYQEFEGTPPGVSSPAAAKRLKFSSRP